MGGHTHLGEAARSPVMAFRAAGAPSLPPLVCGLLMHLLAKQMHLEPKPSSWFLVGNEGVRAVYIAVKGFCR